MKRYLLFLLPLVAGAMIWFVMKDQSQAIVDNQLSDNTADRFTLRKQPKKDRNRAKDDYKFDNPDKFAEFHRRLRTGSGELLPSYPSNYQMIELGKALSRKKAFRTEANNFKERGPGNVPGRTRALVVHPDDPKNTWIAGAAGGGVWKTTNGGQLWTHLTAGLPTLSVSCIAIAPSSPDVLYVGTGEGFFAGGSGTGSGIFKSEDGGQTWSQLQSTTTPDFQNVSRIVIDPNDPNHLLASAGEADEDLIGSTSTSGIFKSTDGGVSWTKVYSSSRPVYQIIAQPNDFNVLYATVRTIGVIKSVDAGLTWTESANGIGQVERTELGISESNPNVLYASAVGSLSFGSGDLYYTSDAGANWKLLTPEEDMDEGIDLLGGQGNYDNTVLVHPYDENTVYVGGVNTYKIGVTNAPDTTIQALLGTPTENIDGFLSDDLRLFTDEGKDIEASEFVGIDIRFREGKTQKAYRFSVPEGRTSGVAAADYTYQDVIDVPFEVWDTKNNRQLAVSVRDQSNDGTFNLKDNYNESREYIFVHAMPYDDALEDSIKVAGGHTYKNMYLIWLAQPTGVTWDATTAPESSIKVEYGDLVSQTRKTEVITDQYGQLDRSNPDYGKNSWDARGGIGIHPDMHQLIAIKGDTVGQFQILSGSDGGMHISDVADYPGETDGTWTMVGNTYNTSQFYGIAKIPGQQMYMGGTQDNGTWLFFSQTDSVADANDAYLDVRGGDGFECQWHATKGFVFLTSVYNNRFVKFDGSYRSGSNGLLETGDDNSPFVTRVAYNKLDPELLFAVSLSGVWRSDNFADSWQLSPITEKWDRSEGYADVEISGANPRIVWAGRGMSGVNNMHVSKDGGHTFQTTKNFSDIGGTSGIYTHPTEEGTAFALFAISQRPKILRTKDFGETWEDITGFDSTSTSTGFPNVPVFSLVVMPHNTSQIWAGTEIGIFESVDDGKTWNILSDFPAVSVWDMRVEEDEIVIGTHGRGIWTATIPELTSVVQPEVTLTPRLNYLRQRPSEEEDVILNLSVDLRSQYDSIQIFRNDQNVFADGANAEPNPSYLYEFSLAEVDSIYMYAMAFKDGVSYKSGTLTFTADQIVRVSAPTDMYETTFDDGKTDFFNQGFRIGENEGFTGVALHSGHPYLTGSEAGSGEANFTALLTSPIIISEDNAVMRFNEVALIELGEDGSAYGDEGFYDYVIVEGSTDLVEWKPLVTGYDASEYPEWLERYGLQGGAGAFVGDETLFKERLIKLDDAFSAGETVYIRFRLFSDPAAAAFGWVIDDLSIQTEDLVSSTEQLEIANSVSLYPSPAPNGVFNLTINNVLDNNLTIKVYNMAGKLVHQERAQRNGIFFNQQIQLKGQPKGVYMVKISDGKQGVTKKLVIE